MPAIFDLLYSEYCRARLAEMRKQLLIPVASDEILKRTGMEAILPAPVMGIAVGATRPRRTKPNHRVAVNRNRIAQLATRSKSVHARRTGQPDAWSNSHLEAIGR
jgi:hypothetical protein